MTIPAILAPVFVQVLLTFILMFWMGRARFKAAKARQVKLLIQEPYFSEDAGKFLARQSILRVVVAAPSCDTPAAGSYLAHFTDILRRLGAAS